MGSCNYSPRMSRESFDSTPKPRERDGIQARTLTKGDVIIVPNGTPHWFKEVSGPVLYYVVKVQ